MSKDNKENNKNNPNPNQNPKGGRGPGFKMNIWVVYGALILMFLGWNFMSGGFSMSDPKTITITEFNNFLDNGDFDRIIIHNKSTAEAFLKEEAMSQTAHEKIPKVDVLKNPNKGPHYKLEIGNDEIFQNRLQQAESEGLLNDYEYKTSGSWTDFLPVLPILIFIGIWIYTMRRMSGVGGGGGGGQTFHIGESRANLFDEKSDITVTCKNVAGLQGAKEDVQEIVDLLKKPDKY